MLILLEGCDGGGKSTLAHTLAATHGVRHSHPALVSTVITHKGQPEPGVDAFQEYELPLEEPRMRRLIRSRHHLVVMDRWHAGEIIYGQLYRGGSRIDDAGMLHIEMLLSALGALKLLVQPEDPAEVTSRLKERGEDFLRLDHVAQVHAWYENHANTYGYHRAPNLSTSFMLNAAAAMSLDEEPYDGSPHRLPGYVGSVAPGLLLVGDQRNDGPRSRLEFPRAFTPWDRAGSALYLMQALVQAKMHRGVGILNANEDGMNLERLHDVPYSLDVVALGNHASKALDKALVKHTKVPHPQWWKRFHHSELAEYAQTIQEAAQWSS